MLDFNTPTTPAGSRISTGARVATTVFTNNAMCTKPLIDRHLHCIPWFQPGSSCRSPSYQGPIGLIGVGVRPGGIGA